MGNANQSESTSPPFYSPFETAFFTFVVSFLVQLAYPSIVYHILLPARRMKEGWDSAPIWPEDYWIGRAGNSWEFWMAGVLAALVSAVVIGMVHRAAFCLTKSERLRRVLSAGIVVAGLAVGSTLPILLYVIP